MRQSDTICAISTPPGVGGIAVLRLSGTDAKAIASKVIRSVNGKTLQLRDRRLCHAILYDGDKVVDDVVVSFFASPGSFTGEDVVEISCHGSIYVQQTVLDIMCRSGARLAEPGEFTMRAFLNRKMNLSQAEAVADLIDSRTETSHRLAISQLRGGYATELETLRQQLIDMAALLELELDFSDEDLEFASREHIKDIVITLSLKVGKLVESFAMGNALKNGVPVAIIGRPNVGKSSLLNALVEDDRAIVSPLAGTTRDTVEETMTIGGVLFRFIDTAGLRDSTDMVESFGIERAYKAAANAMVIIYVQDASVGVEGLDDDFTYFAGHCDLEGKIIIKVFNKSDLTAERADGRLYVSAKEKRGIEELKQLILSSMDRGAADDVLLTNARHKEAMQKMLEALDNVRQGLECRLTADLLTIDIRDALYHLGSITGAITSEEILSSVFSRFCVGK